MFMMTMNTKSFEKFLDEHAKKQIPYASAMAINRLLFEGKKGTERDMDRTYDGGAEKWTKWGVQYVKATYQAPVGILYIKDDRPYVLKTIDGGDVLPKKEVLIKPVNISVNRHGNIKYGAVKKKYHDDRYFVGKPYRGNAPNSARKGIKYPASDPDVGLWERVGKRGPRGGIARQKVRMIVSFSDRRFQKPFFPAREMAKVRFQKTWRRIFGQELAKAKIKAIQRGK